MDNLNINQIDFKWVDETDDTKLLKKAIKLLKDDGGYFPDLEKYIEDKLVKLDKKFKVLKESTNERYSPEDIKKQTSDILNWEKDIKKSDKILSEKTHNQNEISDIQKKKLAETEKFKGNELMKTKEFNEAINCYNTSINLDSKETTTYCNRALAFIKLKQYEKGLKDCNEAIFLKRDYSKAYYRRSTCLLALNRFREAFDDLLFILKDAPSNQEILNEITNLKEKWAGSIGSGEWSKLYKNIDEEIEMAKIGKLKSKVEEKSQILEKSEIKNQQPTNIDSNKTAQPVQGGFKKIKIVEEDIEEVVDTSYTTKTSESKQTPTPTTIQQDKQIEIKPEPQKNISNKNDQIKIEVKEKPKELVPEVHQEITDHLKKIFEKFIKNGEEIKKQLSKLMDKGDLKKAEEIARSSLKDCQNFIKDFKVGTKYHMQLEKAISDLNSFLSIITTKQKLDAENKLKESESSTTEKSSPSEISQNKPASVSDSNKYFRTKILPEEMRENATKLAEAAMNFDEFPKTSYGFEKAYNSMKKRLDVFYKYLKFLNAKNLSSIYQTAEISYGVLTGILSSLKQFSLESSENAITGIEYLLSIPKTKNFNLIKKFLKKSDKEELKILIENLKNKYISEYQDLVKDVDLEKIYF